MNVYKWKREGDKFVGIAEMAGYTTWETSNGWWAFTDRNSVLHGWIKTKHKTPEDAMFDVERWALGFID